MKSAAAGAVIVMVFALANVVAAGVYLVLWPIMAELSGDETYLIVAAIAVGILAVGCGLSFIAGAAHHLPRWLVKRS